ncbi:MAG: penicillin acylase family protein [Gemmatimonadales bacterium]|nr:MAG: penicillin acylase family protein [Gemmatimonadales bacterium]
MQRLGIILLSGFGGVLILILVILVGGLVWMRGSLPPLDGSGSLPGLSATATLQRDSLGIAVIRTRSYEDAIRTQGFAHGQDRFFQMDLLRRLVAGEMAALFGEVALASDRRYRPFGYREAARDHLQHLPPRERTLLNAYVEGVNAGLRSLGRRPPEYLVVRSEPDPWRAEDSILAVLAFYDILSVDHQTERHLHTLFEALPRELATFLTPDATRFDALVWVEEGADPTGGYRPLPLPGPEVVDLRDRDPGPSPTIRLFGDFPGGSNAWAVAFDEGLPVVANDPHLSLGVPNVWYRAEFHWDGGRVFGAGPPGLPGILVGLTDHLAWGITAALVDQTDLILVEVDSADSLSYRTPDGPEPFQFQQAVLEVRGAAADSLTVVRTRWGPVLFRDHEDRPLAFRSPALDPGGVSLRYLELAASRTVEAAQGHLAELGGPALSLVLADRSGAIGWIVSGVLPQRRGMDGRLPVSWASPEVGWDGVRPPGERPSVVLREPGLLKSANQRLLPLPESRSLSHQWMLPTRARRIQDLLQESPPASPETHSRLQLDTRSLAHDPIRNLLLEWIPPEEEEPALAEARAAAAAWDGTAAADSREFAVLVVMRESLRDAVLSALLSPAAELDPRFVYGWPLADEPVLRILEERPDHLLPPPHEDWEELIRAAVIRGMEVLADDPAGGGTDLPWGQRNRARISHPFGELSTALGWLLNLPPNPLPGWAGVIRAQSPTYGQSLRFTGRPGEPETATFQMPGGQSGHFLSPFYQAGHDAWVRGDSPPLQAGAPIHVLRLRPGG